MGISTSMKSRDYIILTLVDITATGVTHGDPGSPSRDQQRNYETVLQAIGLRAQPISIQPPRIVTGALDSLEFGEFYQGEHKVWTMGFSVEHDDIWREGNDPVAGLKKDFSQVPIITGLAETAKFMLPIFYPYGSIKNIYFINASIDLNIL